MIRPFIDSLVNFATGLGVFGKDPTATAHYHLHVLDRNELENAYRSDWIARAIVDAPADDATREWRGWFGNADEIEKLEEVEKKLYLQRKMRWALIRARLYGGGGLVLGIDDGRNTWEPVDWDKCDVGCLKFVVVMNRYELMAGPRIYNVFSEWYTRPEYYTVATPLFGFHYEAGGTYPTLSGSNPNLLPAQRENYGQNTSSWLQTAKNRAKSLFTGQEEGDYARQITPSDGMVKMHPERVIELTGNELPDWRLVPMGGWWGDSVLQTADEMLKDFGMAVGGIANMVNDAKMDVVKIPGLSKSLANQEYASRLIQRFQMANYAKGAINTLLLEGGPPDKAEEWQRIQTSFNALPQLMREYMTIAGAAGGVPMSRLMGSAPGRGLNASGSGGGDIDIRNYYDRITSRQESEYRPALHPLDKAVKLSALGKDDPDVSYAWNPLYKENPLEQAQVALAKAQAYQIDVNAGLINSEVLREARINQLDADEIYPGLQDAIDEFGSEPEEPETPPWTPQSGPGGFPPASSGVPGKPAISGPPGQKALPGPAKGPQQPQAKQPGSQPREGIRAPSKLADRLLSEMEFLRDEISVLRRPWADTVEARVITDATPRTLYVRRDVLNGDDIVKWAKGQGFETTLPADDLHVTICYSRTPVDWMKVNSDEMWSNDSSGNFTVPAGGARMVEKFGDAIVLLFNSSRLSYRHEAIKQAGASWDHPEYQPHITITWEPGGFDWKACEPYRGPIELGPEIFEEVNEGFRSEIIEDGFNPDQPRDDHGRWSVGAEHGLPEGSQFVEGRGILGSGKVGVVVPGHGILPGSMIGNLHPTEQAAAHEARQLVANKAAYERAKQERANQLKGIASRLSAGEEPTHSDLATLGLKEKAGLKWFMPAASELFGISSRAVRPHIAPLIKVAHSMGGVKLESVHSASGLKAIAAGLKSAKAIDADPKKPKAEVDYGPGKPEAHCGICKHFDGEDGCELVAGEIDPEKWCKLFEARRSRASRTQEEGRK